MISKEQVQTTYPILLCGGPLDGCEMDVPVEAIDLSADNLLEMNVDPDFDETGAALLYSFKRESLWQVAALGTPLHVRYEGRRFKGG